MKRLPYALLCFCMLCPLLASAAPAEKAPNIIYILADDLGYGDISCFGQEKFSTPNIDRLANEGIKLTQHYSGSTVCAPSRCALMTGMHTGHCLVRGNSEVQPVGQSPLAGSALTIAEILKKAGYKTGGFGKWGLGFPGSEGDPMHQGFDRFYGYNCQRNAHTYFPTWLYDDLKQIPLDGKTFSHTLIMEEALKWIRSNKDEPFFCYLPIAIPHAAMHAPEEDMAPWRKKFPQFENKTSSYGGATYTNAIAAFAAMMTIFDRDVGRVLDLVVELGLDENTLIIFTSDNGPHHEGGHDPEFFNSNGPLKGHKRNLTEGGIRVPFLARWPGKIEPNTSSDHVSAFWDFLPTACEVAGIEIPGGIDGISFLPALTKQAQAEHGFLYWEFYERQPKRAIRFGQWKAIQRNVREKPKGPVELYNLANDLGETKNVAGENPDIVAQARAYFAESHKPSGKWTLHKKNK